MSDSAAVVYHEYGHGLTGRLVGGGSGCCAGVVGNALAEGWSDWYAMDLLVADGHVADGAGPGDVRFDAYFNAAGRTEALDCAVGDSPAICPGEGTAGPGGYTFGDRGLIRGLEEHANGEIWAQTLWDLRGKLGAYPARCIITGGLRLFGGSPSFLDARDAILEHAVVVGVPQSAVWEVFAGRGMGPDADELTSPLTEDFDVPDDLPPPPAATGSCGGGGGTTDPPPSGPPRGGVSEPAGPTGAAIAAALDADFRAIAKRVKKLRLRGPAAAASPSRASMRSPPAASPSSSPRSGG
jgi:extracellular elastinolytic metalloproteinase